MKAVSIIIALNFILLSFWLRPTLTHLQCALRHYSYGSVCVCNSTYCDTLDEINPKGPNEFILVSSSEGGLRFSVTNGKFDQGKQYFIRDHVTEANVWDKMKSAHLRFKRFFGYNHDDSYDDVEVCDDIKGWDAGREKTLAFITEMFNLYPKDPEKQRKARRCFFKKSIEKITEKFDLAKKHVKKFVRYRFKKLKKWFPSLSTAKIQINRNRLYQKIVGFGGALTGAVSYNLELIPPLLRYQIYQTYFSKNHGIGYNFIRIPIGGCDFDLKPWAYNEFPENDARLSNFTNLDPRDMKKIAQIKEIENISNNYGIKLFASAWSPPPWMKSNNEWSGKSHLREEYLQTWADYHLKYLELMKANNISIWAISTGNEPLNGVIGWLFVRFMSLGWTPEYQGKWLTENLGPTLRKSNFKNIKIFGNDDQRYTFPAWFIKMDKNELNATKYLDGLAVHWYWDKAFAPTLLDLTHEKFDDKLILNTESCVGDKPWETHGPELGNWYRAEKYITSYIEDFQHWVNGWIDWNLVLDEEGGPNYVKNFVDSPIIINMTSRTEFYKQPIFYGIGHFSKFIHENSRRIESQSNDKRIHIVAFERPDKRIVAIIYNSKRYSVRLEIFDSNHDDIVIKIPPKSVHTIIYL